MTNDKLRISDMTLAAKQSKTRNGKSTGPTVGKKKAIEEVITLLKLVDDRSQM